MAHTFAIKALPLCFILMATFGCTHSGSNGTNKKFSAVSIDSLEINDSLSDINESKIHVYAKIAYPSFYKDEQHTEKIQKLFSQHVLNIRKTDSLNIRGLIAKYTTALLNAYRMPEENNRIMPSMQDESEDVARYDILQMIYPVDNSRGLICFCKEAEMKKEGLQAMKTKTFYSFDIETMEKISIDDILDENHVADVNNLLKLQLLKQEKVETPSQLVDLGFFNIDNLSINENFFFTDNGIQFNYEPYEIACFAVGETSIHLTFDNLQPFLKDHPIVHRLINSNE